MAVSSIPLRSQPVLLCGLPGSGYLGTATAQAFCSSSWTLLTMILCSPWLPGRKTHPAQPRPPTKCVTWGPQPKQDGGWVLEVTWPPLPPPRPPAAQFSQRCQEPTSERFEFTVKNCEYLLSLFLPPCCFEKTYEIGPVQRGIFASSLGKKSPCPNSWEHFYYENLGGTTMRKIDVPISKVYWTEDWVPWWWSVQWPWGKYGWHCGLVYRKRGHKRGPCHFYPQKIPQEATAMGDCSQNKFRILRGTLKKIKFIPCISIPPPSTYSHFYEATSTINTY